MSIQCIIFVSLMFKTTAMKKVKTLKDLQNHPLVQGVEKEYNPNVFDGYDWTYWLYLKDDYWFNEEQIGCIHEPTIKGVIDVFNSMTIGKRADRF